MGVWNDMRKRSLGQAVREEEKVKPDPFDSQLDGHIIWTANPITDISEVFKVQRKTLKETQIQLDEIAKKINDIVWWKSSEKCDYFK